MFQELGVQAMVNISSHLIFIIITWQLLRAVRIEEIFKKNRIVEARILIAFITIAIGSTVSHFFIDLIHWMQQIRSEERRVGKECRSRWRGCRGRESEVGVDEVGRTLG